MNDSEEIRIHVKHDDFMELYDRLTNLSEAARWRSDEASGINNVVNAQYHAGETYAYEVVKDMLRQLYTTHRKNGLIDE